ncbi:hypothetical protein SUGI_0546730 [Cryptomeria japonica]|nr:hypothetical protein SUGI_0546730 [Cryptomeria japonica]
MLRLKWIGFRICSSSTIFSSRALSICPDTQKSESENPVEVVSAQGLGSSRKAILNRPFVLNALTTSMVSQLHKLYQAWEDRPDIGFVVMKGAGDRAFCSGGDIVRLYQFANQGKLEECKDFFIKAYQFVYHVGTYLKPHVAILDGLTMGGGAGISIPGTFRVATNKTVFGAPETHIGFHPDAGASFFLSHLPGSLGEYLALTGERLNGAEMVVAGLATHFSMSTRISSIEERLGTLVTNDPSVLESALDEYSDVVIPNSNSSLRRMDTIDHCFSKETVEEIICALETEAAGQNDEWCRKTIGKLKEASPLSLKIALRSIREGRSQTFHQCLVREYRTTCHVLSKRVSGDFFEGIRARLIDKDFSPKWDPPCLEQVSREVVNHPVNVGLNNYWQ